MGAFLPIWPVITPALSWGNNRPFRNKHTQICTPSLGTTSEKVFRLDSWRASSLQSQSGSDVSSSFLQQFPRVTSIGSLPQKPSENPVEPRRSNFPQGGFGDTPELLTFLSGRTPFNRCSYYCSIFVRIVISIITTICFASYLK